MLRLLPAQEGLDDAHAAAAAGTRMLWRFWLFGLVVDGLDGIVRDEWRCKQFADACDIPDAGLAREPAVITDTVEALRQDMHHRSSTAPITKPLSIRGDPRRLSGVALHLR